MIGRQLEGETVICKPTQFSNAEINFRAVMFMSLGAMCGCSRDTDRKWRNYSRLIIAGSQRICFVMQCSIVRKPREASEIRSADSIFLFYFFVQIPPLLLFPWRRNKMALATRLPLTAWLLFKAKNIQKTSNFDFPSQSQCYEKE